MDQNNSLSKHKLKRQAFTFCSPTRFDVKGPLTPAVHDLMLLDNVGRNEGRSKHLLGDVQRVRVAKSVAKLIWRHDLVQVAKMRCDLLLEVDALDPAQFCHRQPASPVQSPKAHAGTPACSQAVHHIS